MKKEVIIPTLSILSAITGAILLNEGTVIVLGGILLMAGMIGCFYSIVEFRKDN
jgi:hypothetical protein